MKQHKERGIIERKKREIDQYSYHIKELTYGFRKHGKRKGIKI